MGESDYVQEKHRELLDLLRDTTETQNPEWEGAYFKIHMALFADDSKDAISYEADANVLFDTLCLYEIDPTPARSWAHPIMSRKLD